MSRWFTSDLHLGDPYMAKRRYCGDDVAKHDAWLAKRWDARGAAS
jgi:calcineurin-like phosphoesterase family protein